MKFLISSLFDETSQEIIKKYKIWNKVPKNERILNEKIDYQSLIYRKAT